MHRRLSAFVCYFSVLRSICMSLKLTLKKNHVALCLDDFSGEVANVSK